MRVSTLPSPGVLANGIRIRIEAAKAISAVEINAGISVNGGKSNSAKRLKDFFDACSTALTAYLDVTAPVFASAIATDGNKSRITLIYGEGISKLFVPDVTDFAVTVQARTVTAVTIDGPFVYLTLNAPLAAGAVSVAYTQSGTVTKRLQDRSNNYAASLGATAVTNSIT